MVTSCLGKTAAQINDLVIPSVTAAHPASDVRATICHLEVVDQEDIERFGQLGIVAQTTPTRFEHDEIAHGVFGA